MTNPTTLHIRSFRPGDETALRAVFSSAIHQLASADYTPEQLATWAPSQYDPQQWAERMQALQPFVAELDGQIVGYADLQPSGYIDHFFVAGEAAGRGVGGRLMRQILASAQQRGISELWAQVSLTAEPFFRHYGFVIEQRQVVEVRGVTLANARMRKRLPT